MVGMRLVPNKKSLVGYVLVRYPRLSKQIREEAGGSLMQALLSPPSKAGATERRNRWIVATAISAAVVVIILLATVPVRQQFKFGFGEAASGAGPGNFRDNWAQSLCPTGARAAVSFTSSGLTMTFSIVAPNGTTIWSHAAPDGSTTFTIPACGTYQLVAAGSGSGSYTVTGTVMYSAPLL
jgi:hypothetical protein